MYVIVYHIGHREPEKGSDTSGSGNSDKYGLLPALMGNCSLGSSEAFKDRVGALQQGSHELHVLCRAPEDDVDSVVAHLRQRGDSHASRDVNARDQLGFTPLMCAIAANNYHISKHLIGSGAHVGVTVQNQIISTTPILLATLGGNKEILSMLLKELALSSNPVGPTAEGSAQSEAALAVLNFKDAHGKGALIYAVENISPKGDHARAIDIIKLLVGSGIALDEVDGRGRTALLLCVLSYMSKEEMRRQRLKQNLLSKSSKLAALLSTYKEAVFFLLESGASCNVTCVESGKTALATAAEAGLFEVCLKMATCGGDVCATTCSGGKCCLDFFSAEQAEQLREAGAA